MIINGPCIDRSKCVQQTNGTKRSYFGNKTHIRKS